MTRKTKIILTLLGLLPLVAFLAYGYIFPSSFFGNQENLRSFIKGYGIWAPLVLIVIQILQVIITPFSHYAVGIAGGFVFGTWYGFLFNYIGRVIGHTIAFFLSRKIGRRLVVKLVKPETLEKYDKFWDKGGSFVLFLIYYLPLFPDDEFSYIAGTSKMKFVPFIVANVLGQVGGSLALAYLGSGMKMETVTTAIVFFVTVILALVFSIIWWKKYRVSDSSSKIDSKLKNW